MDSLCSGNHLMDTLIDDDTWSQYLKDFSTFQVYLVKRGVALPADLQAQLQRSEQLQIAQRAAALRNILPSFAQLTAPVTLLEITDRESSDRVRLDSERRRKKLIQVGIAAVVAMVLTTTLGNYARNELIGTSSCAFRPCTTFFLVLILAYGASLGVVGAVTYELFHASGIVRDGGYGVFDQYRSNARIVLGLTFGWIFSITVSAQSLANLMNMNLSGEGVPGVGDFVLIMLPFLVGYSSVLVTSVLDRLVDTARTTLGLTDSPKPPTVPPPSGSMSDRR